MLSGRGLVYTVSLMTTRICTSRSTVLLAGPALLAVLAILAGTPVWTASTNTSRLAAASMVVFGGEAPLSAVVMTSEPRIPQVAVCVSDHLCPVHVDRHRIGLHRLVLPPPSS